MTAFGLFAETLEQREDGKVNLNGLIDTLRPRKLPSSFPQLFVYIELRGEPEESESAVMLTFELIDPGGHALRDEAIFPGLNIPATTEGRTKMQVLKVFENVPFSKPGTHLIRVLADGQALCDIPLTIATPTE